MGTSPLMEAKQHGHSEAVRLLTDGQADDQPANAEKDKSEGVRAQGAGSRGLVSLGFGGTSKRAYQYHK